MNIVHPTVNRLERAYHQGDWHDKPLRYEVIVSGELRQCFSTKKDATRYASLRRRSIDQVSAISRSLKG
jgi:hypothetical protein